MNYKKMLLSIKNMFLFIRFFFNKKIRFLRERDIIFNSGKDTPKKIRYANHLIKILFLLCILLLFLGCSKELGTIKPLCSVEVLSSTTHVGFNYPVIRYSLY